MGEMNQLSPDERPSACAAEQTMDTPSPQNPERITAKRVQQRTVEQITDVPSPQIREAIAEVTKAGLPEHEPAFRTYNDDYRKSIKGDQLFFGGEFS